jgi:hypothetical protein
MNKLNQILLLSCLAALIIGCGNKSEPEFGKSNSSANTKKVFEELNNTVMSSYTGIWQLYKRKPYDENERLITENKYLDLSKDYTYKANGWNIFGSGEWLPSFNISQTGDQVLFILFTNSKYERDELTSVKAELEMENGSQMLKITALDNGSVDYYIRK